MLVQCSNQACKSQYDLDLSKLTPGSLQNMRCKCGQDTKFQVPGAPPVANPASKTSTHMPPLPPTQAGNKAGKTYVLEDTALTGASMQIGWLVVHDEHTHSQTLPLVEGRNVIGRKSPDKPCQVMIDTEDRHMSRNHAVIEVSRRPNGHYQYLISDCGSANGTFINGNDKHRLSSQDQVYLKDDDIIQLGKTKVVLKTGQTAGSAAEARQEVGQRDFHKTVSI